MRYAIVIAALSACVSSSSVTCSDGSVCPGGTTCRELDNPSALVCASSDQITACQGKAELDTCGDMLRCYSGVCLPAGCGNGRMDPGELCDDGNTLAGDGCSADCTSTEKCGDGAVDLIDHEMCDDGNRLDHDGCSSTCQAEELHWIPHAVIPGQRFLGTAAYDPLRSRVVMFGGESCNAPDCTDLADTWQWDGADWAQYLGPAPSSRHGAASAFDGSRVVLFGGLSDRPLADTWGFDGTAWQPLPTAEPPVGPPARWLHVMAYDSHRKRLVMFGGIDSNSNVLGDTWEWDGTTWTQNTATPAPAARSGAMMAYDPKRGVIVLAGGGASTLLNDVWEYDGTWHDRTPASGPTVNAGVMAFDTASGQLVAFANGAGGTNADHTYAWVGTTWVDLALTVEPPPRNQMLIASAGARLLMIGGFNTQAEEWIFDGGAWSQPTAPSPRYDFMIANDQPRGQLVMFGGQSRADNSYLGETWLFTKSGWQQVTTGTMPGARSNGAIAYDGGAHDVLMFGGTNGSALAETWAWDGAWHSKSGTMPPARYAASLAYDGQAMILIGGLAPPIHEVWSWDGANWTNITTTGITDGVIGPVLGFDPIRTELVSVGGFGPKTWTFGASGWASYSGASPTPSFPMPTQKLAWAPARQRLVFAGDTGDAWEWNGATTQWQAVAASNPPAAAHGAGVTTLDGAAVRIFEGFGGDSSELRWQGPGLDERCDGSDADGDGLVGCADPDCWSVCTPSCAPGTTCDAAAPKCGDGTCNAAFETCRTCPADCTCTPVCGDFICDPGETCPGDCP